MKPSDQLPFLPTTSFGDDIATESELRDRAIGEILASTNSLTGAQIQQVLEYQQRNRGVRFGEAAISLGLASRDEVIWALSQQFHYPYADTKLEAPLHKELVMANGPFSAEVECFRVLRSQLLNGVLAPDAPRRALALVSPDIGDGKTFVLSNLAVAFSQLRGRTVIVDADMRSSRLHEVFNLDNHTGLSDILNGRSQANVIRPVADLPNLYLLPVGTTPPNPAELIHHPSFGLLIHELISRFDTVLVDTPAAVHGSDASVIAACCGAALVVTRKDQTRSARLTDLLRQLGQTRTQMAGVLMNAY